MRFFFYGTLIAGSGNEALAGLHDTLACVGPAAAHGRLYAIRDPGGWYPALLPGPGLVHGMLYESLPRFGRRELARMDAYEEFDVRRPAASLYRRRAIGIRRSGASVVGAQSYVYNRALPLGASRIADGDFHGWLVRTGAAAFGTRG